MYHFIGIYNIVSVIHHNTQESVMDRVKIIIQRHKNNYFKNWSTQELTFPQYLLQYLLQYYTQVKKYFFKSQYWYNNGIQYWNKFLQYISWAFSTKTTQGNLSIHEFWNVLVRFSLSYLRSLFLGVSGSVGLSSAFRFSAFLTKIKIKQRHFF